MGVMTFKYTPKRGKLIGALAVEEDDQIFAITSAGGVIRTEVSQIRPSSRATMGVRLVDLADGVDLLAIDVNVEDEGEEEATAVAKGEKTIEEAQEATGNSQPDGPTVADGEGSEDLGYAGEAWDESEAESDSEDEE